MLQRASPLFLAIFFATHVWHAACWLHLLFLGITSANAFFFKFLPDISIIAIDAAKMMPLHRFHFMPMKAHDDMD